MNVGALKNWFLSMPSRRRKRLLWVIGALIVYTLVGFLVLPPIVRAVAVKRLAKELGREVAIEKVRLNPFVLCGTIRGLSIKDPDGETLLRFDEAYANFQLWSFLGKPWVFREVRVLNPYARVQINKDYSLNVSDLVTKFSQSSQQPDPAAPPSPLALHVGRLHVSGARLSLSDFTPRTQFRRVVGPVEITLTEFRTDPTSRNPYAFSGTTDSGESYFWSGYFHLDPIRSGGELKLEGLSIPKYAALYQDLVRFEIKDGRVDARSEYSFALTPTNTFAIVSNAAFSLKSLRVAAKGSAENLLELEDLSVSAVSADAAARTADVGSVFVNGGRVAAQRDSAGTFNFIELSRPATDATNVPAGIQFTLQAATNAFAALIGTTNLWSASLRQLNVTNFVVRWQDDACSRPVNVTVDDIAVSGRHLSNLPGSNQTVDVSCRWETNGVVRLEVAAQILPPSADVKLALKDLDLRPVDPYLEPFVNVFVIHSKVNLDGLAQLRMGSNSLPEVTFRGDAALNDFATADGVFRGDLVKWKSVQISGVDASLSPPVVAVKQVSVTEPHARITIETNRMVNVFVALRIGDTNAVGGESNEVAVARPTEPKPETSKAGMGRRLGSLLRKTLAANTNASGSALLPAIAVDSVVLSNASIQFNDRSLQPPVSASILDINGSVGSLSSAELNRADLHLTAKVDGTGPIEISGKINPLNESAPTELEVTFQNVDLSPASPYAARFLGYRLNRGKLNLNVNCGITDQKLKATNLIALDQLKLGQRVNSPDATQLPVKLAVIILTDSEGKIKLDVPIEGDLDDPQFRFGKAVAAVIGNIITKLVTSPFSTLGGLFGGKGEEIAYQDFIPGSAELLPASVEKLDAVLNGLAKQPDLELGVEGSYDPVKDRDALRRQKLDRQFRQEKWSAMRSGAQARVNPDAVTISPDERQEYLAKAYETLLEAQQAAEGGASDSQSVRKQPAPEKAAEAMVRAFRPTPPPAAINDMERTVLDSIAVNDGELQELAVRRAQQVRDRILESGRLSPERVYMVDVQVPPGNNAASRVYLHLQ